MNDFDFDFDQDELMFPIEAPEPPEIKRWFNDLLEGKRGQNAIECKVCHRKVDAMERSLFEFCVCGNKVTGP